MKASCMEIQFSNFAHCMRTDLSMISWLMILETLITVHNGPTALAFILETPAPAPAFIASRGLEPIGSE